LEESNLNIRGNTQDNFLDVSITVEVSGFLGKIIPMAPDSLYHRHVGHTIGSFKKISPLYFKNNKS
jgi:hypothetical protein